MNGFEFLAENEKANEINAILSIPAETACIHIDSFIEILQGLKEAGEEVFCVAYKDCNAGFMFPAWGDEILFLRDDDFTKHITDKMVDP